MSLLKCFERSCPTESFSNLRISTASFRRPYNHPVHLTETCPILLEILLGERQISIQCNAFISNTPVQVTALNKYIVRKSVYSAPLNDSRKTECWWGEEFCICLHAEINQIPALELDCVRWEAAATVLGNAAAWLASALPNWHRSGVSVTERLSLPDTLHLAICFAC